MTAAHASVVREGTRQSNPATEVVPGDIIIIEEGNTIPADARVIQSTALQTAEAALTGESLPVLKDDLPIAEEVGLGDRDNMIFSGTVAVYGARACSGPANGNEQYRDGSNCWGCQR
jgi:Ca2+-transporting ATPase